MLIVTGKFEPAKTLALIAKYFGAIPKPTRTLPQLYTQEPVQDGERSAIVRRVGSQKLVGILYRTLSGAHPDSVAIDALGEIMTIAPSGRLYRTLVETKKATAVEAWTLALHDPGTIIFWAQVPVEDAIEPARDAMLATLADVAKQPITADEVERVRAKALKAFDETVNDPEKLAVALSEAIATGDWRLIFLGRDLWRKVTPADVQRVALAYLKPANRTVGVFLPDPTPDRAPEPPPVDIAALVKDYKGDASVVAGETFEATPANLEARTQRYTMPSGLKVALLPKKTRGDTVRFSLRLHQGDEKSLFGRSPSGSAHGRDAVARDAKRDRQAFEDELDRLRAKLGLSGSETDDPRERRDRARESARGTAARCRSAAHTELSRARSSTS